MPSQASEITVILDRSGSMQSIASDAIGGFNAFVQSQRREEGAACLSLVLFDDQYEIPLRAVPLAAVPPLTSHSFIPRGSTALFDAVGRTLDDTAGRIATLPVAGRPEKVIIAILTDGEVNASRHFSPAQIRQKITHFRELLGWEFVFLAANSAGTAAVFSDMAVRVADKRKKAALSN